MLTTVKMVHSVSLKLVNDIISLVLENKGTVLWVERLNIEKHQK